MHEDTKTTPHRLSRKDDPIKTKRYGNVRAYIYLKQTATGLRHHGYKFRRVTDTTSGEKTSELYTAQDHTDYRKALLETAKLCAQLDAKLYPALFSTAE